MILSYNVNPDKRILILKKNILLSMPVFSNSLPSHTTGNLAGDCSPHPGFPGGSQRVLQTPHIEQNPSKQNNHKAPPSPWCPASGAKLLKQGQHGGCALPLLAGWSDATVTSVAAATQGRGLFRNLGFKASDAT